jgi:transcriptional regulator with XRE-family HTH domain
VGNRLRALLKQQGRTQRELANAIGLTEAAVSRHCAGIDAPDGVTKIRIAAFLGVAVEDLGIREQHRTGPSGTPARLDRVAFEKALERKGISAAELARQAGVTRQSISVSLTGRSMPRPPTLRRIARILEVDPNELIIPDPPDSDVALDRAAQSSRRSPGRRKV